MDVYTRSYVSKDAEFMWSTATPREIARFRVDQGDVLLTKDSETPDDIGIASVVLDQIEDLVCGYHLALLKPDHDQVDSLFLAKQLSRTEVGRYYANRARGSTRYGLTYGSIASTPIRLAPVAEQRRIAEILFVLDQAIEQTEALIGKLSQIKAGMMHDLFTRGIMPNGELRPSREEAPQLYKDSPLGWIPKDWEVRVLDEIALRGSGHTPSRLKPEYWDGDVAWISLADSWRLDRVHISETEYMISQAGIRNSSAILHPKGIVVLSRDAGVGKSAITTREMAVSQHFICWRCGRSLNHIFDISESAAPSQAFFLF
jgi:type I restriction enzyme S subunit